jgi:hypothetical protein
MKKDKKLKRNFKILMDRFGPELDTNLALSTFAAIGQRHSMSASGVH